MKVTHVIFDSTEHVGDILECTEKQLYCVTLLKSCMKYKEWLIALYLVTLEHSSNETSDIFITRCQGTAVYILEKYFTVSKVVYALSDSPQCNNLTNIHSC